MRAYDPELAKLEKRSNAVGMCGSRNWIFKLRDDARADIEEKDKLYDKLFQTLVDGFPEGAVKK